MSGRRRGGSSRVPKSSIGYCFFKVSYEENEGMNGCLNDCIVQQQILRKIHCDNMTKYVVSFPFFLFENFKSTSSIDFKFFA